MMGVITRFFFFPRGFRPDRPRAVTMVVRGGGAQKARGFEGVVLSVLRCVGCGRGRCLAAAEVAAAEVGQQEGRLVAAWRDDKRGAPKIGEIEHRRSKNSREEPAVRSWCARHRGTCACLRGVHRAAPRSAPLTGVRMWRRCRTWRCTAWCRGARGVANKPTRPPFVRRKVPGAGPGRPEPLFQ